MCRFADMDEDSDRLPSRVIRCRDEEAWTKVIPVTQPLPTSSFDIIDQGTNPCSRY